MSQATANSTEGRLSGREAAIARRQALSMYGKQASTAGSKPQSASEARLAARAASAPTAPSTASRPAASSQPAASSPSPADESTRCGCQHPETPSARIESARPAAAPVPLSAARQRRIEQSLKGRGEAPPCRPCGRVRPEPEKVEFGTTLSGTPVSGNQLERSAQVTGNEAGSCRPITGTEYIGSEQYGQFCGASPAPAAAKVGTSSTSRGGRVTGTEVGRSARVTGGESGTCKRVTGTEYLAAEQAATFCGSTAEPHPEKSVQGLTAGHNPITGADLARSNRVTGSESGAGRAITGSAYADASVAPAAQGEGTKKVKTSHTIAGSAVSGTLLGRSSSVTGDEPGACKRVTGSDYISAEEFSSYCRTEPYQAPAKVGVSRTLKGQDVSGSQVGRSAIVTGDEYGACKPVTGTSYIGADQYAEFCAARSAAEAINRARLGHSPVLTGMQPGPDAHMTGNERGVCQPVSGTPYQGEDQYVAACGQPSMAAHYRTRRPDAESARVAITGKAPEGPAARPAGGFSVSSPVRTAAGSETRRITGSAYGGGGAITGSMARATGLVSGTPEFRYNGEAGGPPPAPVAQETAPERITGEGNERRITGDAWDRGDRVTGTEGHSATRRNPTQRGDPRGNAMNARAFREVETPAPATSRVTGSSGNSAAGATVTLSGGARG